VFDSLPCGKSNQQLTFKNGDETMKTNYYFAGVEVILIDVGDVFTMIDIRGKIYNISRAAGADMLAENENRIIDDYEMNSILSAAGIVLEGFEDTRNDEGAKRLINILTIGELADGWTEFSNDNRF
jgi:hypothetical protein